MACIINQCKKYFLSSFSSELTEERERDSSHSRSLLLARSLLGEKKDAFCKLILTLQKQLSFFFFFFCKWNFSSKKDSLVKAAWPTFHLALCAAGWFFIICAMPCNDDLLLSFLWKRKEKVKWILLMWIFTIWTTVHQQKLLLGRHQIMHPVYIFFWYCVLDNGPLCARVGLVLTPILQLELAKRGCIFFFHSRCYIGQVIFSQASPSIWIMLR